MARVPGAAKSRRTESAAQLCCGTRAAGFAAPAAEPALPPRRAPAARPRGWRGSSRGAAREHLGRRRRRARRFRSCARARVPRAPRLQVRRPRRASPCDSAARAAAARQQTRCGQPAGTREEEAPRLGRTGEDRGKRAGRDAGAGASPPASPSQLGCRCSRRVPGATDGLGGEGRAGRGGPSPAGPGLFGTFRVNFQSARSSGFCPLDFSPACGRLKGNQKRVSDMKTPY